MIERMVEVEDVDIARAVDDMKKMKCPRSCVQRGRSEGGGSRVQGTMWAQGKAVKNPTMQDTVTDAGDLAWASIAPSDSAICKTN